MESGAGLTSIITMETSVQEIIRSAIQKKQISKWGFSIYKCNTILEDRWKEFVDIITSTALEYLSEDQDISDLLTLPIVSDSSLEQATWQEARTHFDAHIREIITPTLEDYHMRPWVEQEAQVGETFWKVDDKLYFRIHNEPRFAYFLYVDETAVESVLNHVRDRKNPEGWIVSLVESNIKDSNLEDSGLDEEDSDDGEEDEENLQQQRKRVRAWDLVRIYATVQSGGWDEDFQEEDGVYENPSL